MPRRIFEQYLLPIIFLISILGIGFALRVRDYPAWKADQRATLYGNSPLLTNYEGYYYLRCAREYMEGSYEATDSYRLHNTNRYSGSRPPLLAIACAFVSRVTGLPLERTAAFLPPFLGVLLAVPVFLTGKRLISPLAGYIAALLCVVAPCYVSRTSMARLNPDCLNVVLMFGVAGCFLEFGTRKSPIRYIYTVAGILLTVLYSWWLENMRVLAWLSAVIPLGTALAFLYRPDSLYERRAGKLVMIPIVLIALFFGGYLLADLSVFLKEVMLNNGQDISAGPRPLFGSNLLFALGIVGLILLFARRFRIMLFLVTPLLVGLAGFFFAPRFAVFLTPLLALGLAADISFLLGLRKYPPVAKRKYGPAAFISTSVLLAAYSIASPVIALSRQSVSRPAHDASTVKFMEDLKRATPEGSVIWANWRYGYAIQYWADRSTVFDESPDAQELIYDEFPMTINNPRLSANFINFYTAHGRTGVEGLIPDDEEAGFALVKRILAATPSDAGHLIRVRELNNDLLVKSLPLRDRPTAEVTLEYEHGDPTTDLWKRFFFPAPDKEIFLYLDEETPVSVSDYFSPVITNHPHFRVWKVIPEYWAEKSTSPQQACR